MLHSSRRFLANSSLSLFGLLLPAFVSAQSFTEKIRGGAESLAKPSGLNQGDLVLIIGGVIRVALSLVGVILLIILLYSGFLWMTAGGDSKRVIEARQRIINAVIGLIIIACAYAIVNFVLGELGGVADGGGSGSTIPSE